MAKLRILDATKSYYSVSGRHSSDYVFANGRYVVRGSDSPISIIDRDAQVEMRTNAVGPGYAAPGRIVIVSPGDAAYPLDRLISLFAAKTYRLPGAVSQYRKFALLDDAQLLQLVDDYKKANPEEWEHFYREQLADTTKMVRLSRLAIAVVFTVAFAIASFGTVVVQG